MTDSFRTIAAEAAARITRKRSRFEAFLIPTRSLEEVERALVELRKAHRDATHVCSAYRLRRDPEPEAGADDDGEPSGSAGLPMLQQLERADLVDVLAAVVRRFGGVKLGVGGLVRAYTDAVAEALGEADVVERAVTSTVEIRFPPSATPAILRTVHRFGAQIERIEYDAEATAAVTLPPSRVPEFTQVLRDASGGKAAVEVRT